MKNDARCLISMSLISLGGVAAADNHKVGPAFAWEREETALTLHNHDKTVWRLVFDPNKPKSYFHPLASIDGRVMTAFEPADHPWHRGLWWSWKYINGVNYWEENPKTGKSDGITKLTRSHAVTASDFSAHIELDFQYSIPEQKPLLLENRFLSISRPDEVGTYVIDWNSKFTATDQPVKLDRTLPSHLGGVNYGGYGGLSLRMAVGLEGFSFRTHDGETTAAASHGKSANWVQLADSTSGITIFDHPTNPRHASPWYLYSGKSMLFFSPAPLFNDSLEVAPGQSITFTYQIIVNSQALTPDQIAQEWKAFTPSPSQPGQP
jgi:Methane oxygenase PmoA